VKPLRLRLLGILLFSLGASHGCDRTDPPTPTARLVKTPQDLTRHCKEQIGEPRVLEVTPHVFVALGFDLGNTIVVNTPDGNVVIDTMMSATRAAQAKQALLARAPGPTRAIIYTHSHIDHVGGASAWIEPGTEIWATDRFLDHFLKQYGAFAQAEGTRGARQFGRSIPEAELPCSALGKAPAFDADTGQGFRPPTRTFSGSASFSVGGTQIDLVEAHGETDDQLFVWLAAERVLLPGDNFYAAFPNLYTIRGARPRPINEWIQSLDAMRAKSPLHLVPSHTLPIAGEARIRGALTDYRDAIQWLRDEVVRGANAGLILSQIVEGMKLPAHLARSPYLAELYGQLDWSAGAYYMNELGWFDGSPESLYSPPEVELAKREVALFGGADKLRAHAKQLVSEGEARFAVHFLSRLVLSGLIHASERPAVDAELAEALRRVAAGVANSNGRAYLLESAAELDHAARPELVRRVDPAIADSLPVRAFFEQMPSRLIVARADVHESLEININEPPAQYVITIRHGVAELVHGGALPGTPTPIGKIDTDAATWKRLALGLEQPAIALATGKLKLEGDLIAIKRFLDRFSRAL